ncbi:YitT family protein [Lacticaseibacillus mingshuiensis]|uniref:YitT family protein n=1 Tax=Lacticaseibacillus mingshuiensis TaxID=2799574 RepID=A0ABW4CKJ2_9LACO|nr:YitT family protein [Lacticaseibacillus mingshuiensis]
MKEETVTVHEAVMDVVWVIIGNAVSAFAYSWIMVKLNIISGGVTASGMIMGKLTPLSVTFWTNAITVACLLAALIFLGVRTFMNSIVSSLAYMGWFTLAQALAPAHTLPVWLGLPIAGLGVGVGYYLCIAHHSSTAGLDVFALVINKHQPKFSVGLGLRLINLIVLGIGALSFGLKSFLLGLIFILIYTETLTLLQKRFGTAEG